MPFTFSHPAAVLPLRRFGGRRLDFAALVVGSFTPDFGYYVPSFKPWWPMHSLGGIALVCLPLGLFLLAAFHQLKRPLCQLLPQPHRGALMPLAAVPAWREPAAIGIAMTCIAAGAGTHVAWDSFTHASGWAAQHLPLLRAPVFRVAGQALPACWILQQISSLGGAALLLAVYRNWLRRRRGADADAAERSGDR